MVNEWIKDITELFNNKKISKDLLGNICISNGWEYNIKDGKAIIIDRSPNFKATDFICNIHKIYDIGHNTITMMIEAKDIATKQEILKKLRNLDIKATPTTAQNKLCKVNIKRLT